MKIAITELQQAINSTLESIKERNGENFEVDIEEDYYNYIPTDSLYKLDKQPTELTIGSLSDNIEEVRKISSGNNNPIPPDLSKIASILRYIGDNLA